MVQPIGREARMEALYRELPHIECKRLCRECCGPVVQTRSMTRLEFERLDGILRQPVALRDFMACSLLRGSECTVYDMRPLICRLWGVVDDPKMRCPHGCKPDRWLTNAESFAFMQRAVDIGGVFWQA